MPGAGSTERGRAYGPVRVWASGAFIAGTLADRRAAPLDRTGEHHLGAGRDLLVCVVRRVGADARGRRADAGSRKARVRGAVPQPCPDRGHCRVGADPGQPRRSTMRSDAALDAGRTFSASRSARCGSPASSRRAFSFVASARFPPRVDGDVLIELGAAGGCALDRDGARSAVRAAAVLQCLHALSFAATHLGAVQFIAHAAPRGPRRDRARLARRRQWRSRWRLAMAVSGFCSRATAPRAYAAMALLAAAGGIARALHLRRSLSPTAPDRAARRAAVVAQAVAAIAREQQRPVEIDERARLAPAARPAPSRATCHHAADHDRRSPARARLAPSPAPRSGRRSCRA